MKKRLNILCAVVLLVLGWSVLETGYYLTLGAAKGMQAGYEYARQKAENSQETDVAELNRMKGMAFVSLMPHALKDFNMQEWMTDSVLNAKTGQYVPAMYSQLMVSVDKPHNPAYTTTNLLLVLLKLAACIWAIVLFFKWVIAVNRSDIFNWRNVRRLRLMGGLMLLDTICSLLTSYLSMRNMEQVFALKGYELSLSGSISLSILLLGLCSLIVAEVFAIGLRMKEEQDLTV